VIDRRGAIGFVNCDYFAFDGVPLFISWSSIATERNQGQRNQQKYGVSVVMKHDEFGVRD
jgi:hypothetical protein